MLLTEGMARSSVILPKHTTSSNKPYSNQIKSKEGGKGQRKKTINPVPSVQCSVVEMVVDMVVEMIVESQGPTHPDDAKSLKAAFASVFPEG